MNALASHISLESPPRGPAQGVVLAYLIVQLICTVALLVAAFRPGDDGDGPVGRIARIVAIATAVLLVIGLPIVNWVVGANTVGNVSGLGSTARPVSLLLVAVPPWAAVLAGRARVRPRHLSSSGRAVAEPGPMSDRRLADARQPVVLATRFLLRRIVQVTMAESR